MTVLLFQTVAYGVYRQELWDSSHLGFAPSAPAGIDGARISLTVDLLKAFLSEGLNTFLGFHIGNHSSSIECL